MQQAIQQATMQQATMQQVAMQQTALKGTRDSGTMTVESRYLKGFQGQNPPSFEGDKIDPIGAEN